MTIDPNAPAFPRDGSPTSYGTPGVSTRTLLAGMAMQGMLGYHTGSLDSRWVNSDCAALAVKHADSLIAALNT